MSIVVPIRQRKFARSLPAAAILFSLSSFTMAAPEASDKTAVPATQPASAPLPAPRQVIDDFLKHVAASTWYDETAKQFVLKSGEDLSAADMQDFLNNSLAILSADFAAGLGALADDNNALAADVFEGLTHDLDPYLSVAAANMAATALVDMEDLPRCLKTLQSVKTAHHPIERYTLAPDHFLFMLGYCQIHNLQYDAADQTLSDFLQRFPSAPERLRVTATQIITEIRRRVPGRMGDVRDLLQFAWRRIDHGDTGKSVAQRQASAVELLSAMIEEAENSEKSGKQGKCNGSGSQAGGAPKGSKSTGTGAKVSALPTGESEAGELRRTRARPGDSWGKMPPRERDEILQSLQQSFPSQYRELLEQYYRELAKDAPTR